jgi:hypothetical protein
MKLKTGSPVEVGDRWFRCAACQLYWPPAESADNSLAPVQRRKTRFSRPAPPRPAPAPALARRRCLRYPDPTLPAPHPQVSGDPADAGWVGSWWTAVVVRQERQQGRRLVTVRYDEVGAAAWRRWCGEGQWGGAAPSLPARPPACLRMRDGMQGDPLQVGCELSS